MAVQPDKIDALIRDCAARLIMPRFNLLKEAEIESKSGPGDLVTIADRETEIELETALTAMHPGSLVIGEEGISAGRMSTDVLRDSSQVIWVIDPVDGTWNFVHGKPEFAVMIACVIGGETRYGWIYDVPANRMLFTAKGEGTFIDGVRQHVAAPKPLAETTGFCAGRYFPPEKRQLIKDFAGQVCSLHVFGCAGHEYLNVASGKYDFAIYNRGRPWDHLAGTLAVQEAGGVAALFGGAPYTPQDDKVALITAANDDLRTALQRALLDKLQD